MIAETQRQTELLSFQDAARMLGYTVKGMRKIVERSRAKANGRRTRGPTITFFQTTKGAPVKFRPEWIEDFIEQNTVRPANGKPARKKTRQKVSLDF